MRTDCPFYHGNLIRRDTFSSIADGPSRQMNEHCEQPSTSYHTHMKEDTTHNFFLDLVQHLRHDMELLKDQMMKTVQRFPVAQNQMPINMPPFQKEMLGTNRMGHYGNGQLAREPAMIHSLNNNFVVNPSLKEFPALGQAQ